MDGCISCPIPIEFTINELSCNNILLILHKPYGFLVNHQAEVMERVLSYTAMNRFPVELRKAFRTRHQIRRQVLEKIWAGGYNERGVKLGIICLDRFPYSEFSMDRVKIKSLAEVGEQKALEIFS